jgi:hypothetical protein
MGVKLGHLPLGKNVDWGYTIWQQGAEENIWTHKRGSNKGLERVALHYSMNIISVIKSRRIRLEICRGQWKLHKKLWSKKLRGQDHLEDLVINRRILIKWILNKYDVRVWTGFNWFVIGTSGGLLWTWYWIFVFYERWKISWAAELLKKSSASWR